MVENDKVMILLHTENGTVMVEGYATFIEDPWDADLGARNPALTVESALSGWACPADPATADDLRKSTVVAAVDLDGAWVAQGDQIESFVRDRMKEVFGEKDENEN